MTFMSNTRGLAQGLVRVAKQDACGEGGLATPESCADEAHDVGAARGGDAQGLSALAQGRIGLVVVRE